ncbi:GDSL-type esterase/lipase family protein [Mesobacillus subterraneus]|uniref:SGNH hydrolase-type esterase domain-containing protein n=1 Tax=Mesobacillus subterraneus TaxID=285983 RepID=A0A427TV60_9BACI|nr:GDSL-type esterase/lipase family protein [Mesobacillus subterraneus]RSD28279.1 hypothetical protein EJA10_07460 [Mesobacillus subterraneus]
MKKKTAFVLFTIIFIAILAAFSIYDKQPVKEQGDTLVVAFGDSLTYGYGDEKGSGYIETLDKKLNEQTKEEVHFTNEAIYGLESSGVLSQLSDIRVTRKLEEADYFILFIGTNDLINSNGGNLEELQLDKVEKGQEVYIQNLKAIIDIIRKNNDQAPILVLGLYNPYPSLGEIEAVIDDWNEGIQEAIQAEEEMVYIPTNDLFRGVEKQQYFSDSLHLNDQGYNLIADRILEKFTFN